MIYYLTGLYPASSRPRPELYVMRDGLINALALKPVQPGQVPFILTDAERIEVASQYLASQSS